jgi:hypothetical protein
MFILPPFSPYLSQVTALSLRCSVLRGAFFCASSAAAEPLKKAAKFSSFETCLSVLRRFYGDSSGEVGHLRKFLGMGYYGYLILFRKLLGILGIYFENRHTNITQ